ncbi:hypothetical protein [Desulfosporosinus sp. SB140]|uniref:hypothetical protein n=1 Tax=Desulfosporosinus paludis TaxID=3115649 RepID=UPI00388F95E9
MSGSISERVAKYLENQSSFIHVDNYLGTLRDNLKVMEEKFNKNFIMVLALIAIFYLFSRSAISEASVGPFKVKDVSIIYLFIPILIAYKYYETNSILAMRRLSRVLHLEMIKQVNRPLFDNKLEYFLLPTSIFLSNEVSFESESNILIKIFLPLMELSIQLGFPAFEVYALYNVYCNFGTTSKSFWFVLVSSFVLMTLGFFTLMRNAPNTRAYNIGSRDSRTANR